MKIETLENLIKSNITAFSVHIVINALIVVFYITIEDMVRKWNMEANGIVQGIVQAISWITSLVGIYAYYLLGSFLYKQNESLVSVKVILKAIAVIPVVGIIIWIYCYSETYSVFTGDTMVWLFFFFYNAPFLPLAALIQKHLPYIYFLFPFITTTILILGILNKRKKDFMGSVDDII